MRYILILLATVCTLCAQHPRMMMNGVVRIDTYSWPTNIPGLALWLDAQSSFAGSADGTVKTTWPDKSGRGLDGTYTNISPGVAYVTNSGINGKLAIAFKGGGGDSPVGAAYQFGTILGTNGYTLFAVGMFPARSFPGYRIMFKSAPGFYFAFDLFTYGDYCTDPGSGAFRTPNDAYYTNGTPFRFAQTQAGGVSVPALYKDGAPLAWTYTNSASTNSLATFNGFGGFPAAGAIYGCTNQIFGELIIYSNVLSGADITNVDNYLKARWGL